jgi:hypothetical protein
MVYEDNQQYLVEDDYDTARYYLENPADYDFFNILEWDEADILPN